MDIKKDPNLFPLTEKGIQALKAFYQGRVEQARKDYKALYKYNSDKWEEIFKSLV